MICLDIQYFSYLWSISQAFSATARLADAFPFLTGPGIHVHQQEVRDLTTIHRLLALNGLPDGSEVWEVEDAAEVVVLDGVFALAPVGRAGTTRTYKSINRFQYQH